MLKNVFLRLHKYKIYSNFKELVLHKIFIYLTKYLRIYQIKKAAHKDSFYNYQKLVDYFLRASLIRAFLPVSSRK